MTTAKSLSTLTQDSDYDPNAMPVTKAREYIRAHLEPVTGSERLYIRAALGRILAEDVISSVNVPAHDNSAMDGYAFRHADLGAQGETTLDVVGTSFAGRPFEGSVSAGQAVRIMTGGVMPVGADTVIMQERVTTAAGRVAIPAGQQKGQNVRSTGGDIRKGGVVFPRGQLMRPAEVGMLASLGIGEISVYRKLRVAFFSTGDELIGVGQALRPGQIYDSNRYTIHAMLTRLGINAIDMGVVGDDPALIRQAFSEASSIADVVITSGGVSVGEADFVKQILNELGEVLFWKVAMRPGRPLAYGKLGKAHFFGLPGNPVSAMVTFYQFVRDALLVLMGVPNPAPLPTLTATCLSALKKVPGRTEFQRGVLRCGDDGRWSVRSTGDQGSQILSSMSAANCFIVLSDDVSAVAPGTPVDVQVFEGFI